MMPFTPPAVRAVVQDNVLHLYYSARLPDLLLTEVGNIAARHLDYLADTRRLRQIEAEIVTLFSTEIAAGRLFRDCFGRWRYLLGKPTTQRTI